MIVSCAVVHDDPPTVYLADDVDTLQWVLAIKLVARTSPAQLPADVLASLRDALLHERWGEAVLSWIEHSGIPVDVYPSFDLFESDRLPADVAAAELRLAPIFTDPEP